MRLKFSFNKNEIPFAKNQSIYKKSRKKHQITNFENKFSQQAVEKKSIKVSKLKKIRTYILKRSFEFQFLIFNKKKDDITAP